MELQGKIHAKLPSEAGISQSSQKPWKKQVFVIETMDEHPKKIAFEAWNDDVRTLETLEVGHLLKVSFNVESREYDGRWYTTARSWKIQIIGK